ncbi:MAG: phosphatase PAP2 family protein [Desulfobacterales bacterium]|nr:MAG: phosphatase PAP2 family protein [Desulfobacterales bacterium]
MASLLDWGIEVVLWFQQFSPALDLPFKAITLLGEETFYLIFMPLVYWCIDRRNGARLFILLLLSAYLNAIAKVLANQPRPFTYDHRVRPIATAEGGGLPSGHTQNAVVIWGYLAARSGKATAWLAAGFLMVAIPLSRVYLGVHFPTDLIGGYLLGALILILFLRLAFRLEIWLAEQGVVRQILISLGGPMILILLNAGGDKAVLSMASVLMGICAGFALERRFVGFSCNGSWWERILRYLLGGAVLFALWGGLKTAFADLEPAALFRFIRYSLLGLWGGVGAPWVFVRMKLADRE